MDETILKVAISGFMHDIGKFAQEGLFVSEDFLNRHADLYQPFFNEQHTHRHAVYTAAFIDHIEKLLPKAFNRANWGLEDPFINLAAGHHKPKTPLQWIVAMADRISSGWDRKGFEEYNQAITPSAYRKTRLLSLFETISVEETGRESEQRMYSYRLSPVSPVSIFPEQKSKIESTSDDQARKEYKSLFEQFIFDLERLMHREESIALWFEHFDSLMMIYTSCIPAARAGKIVPDVSLYDHSRVTSALAVALFLYHHQTNTLSAEQIQGSDDNKFLIIKGDFSGIQSFIFNEGGEAGRGRSKILRGRSFSVSLFSELAADMLLKKIGLPCTSVVLNAAGNFTIIAPNIPEAHEAVLSCEKTANDWLLEITYGESSLGFSSLEASPKDFLEGRFVDLWDRLGMISEKKKTQKIPLDRLGVVRNYLDTFRNDLNRPMCPFCGKRASDTNLEGSAFAGERQSICRVCRDHIFLGQRLTRENRLAITTTDADIKGDNKLLEPIFGVYQVAFIGGGLKEMARSGKLLKYWDVSTEGDGSLPRDVTVKNIGGYVPLYREEDLYDERYLEGEKSEDRKLERLEIKLGEVKTFEHIACKALNADEDESWCGLQAIGVLKADVDHLGHIMSCGMKKHQYTVSRLAALSRQLNLFFTVFIPHLLKTDERFNDIYTVFAGGDDLFLIGPWNRIIEFVVVLRERFSSYVCGNPEIHFSAGISLHKPYTPIQKLSLSTEAALEQAKVERNSITLFSETAVWNDFLEISDIRETLKEWTDNGTINNAMLYRLNAFIPLASRERRLNKRSVIGLEDMECLKWRALFAYTVERNTGKGLKKEEKEKAVNEVSRVAEWLSTYGSGIKIALWDVLYNKR